MPRSYLFRLDLVDDYLSSSGPLLIITADGTENGFVSLAISNCRGSCRWGYHDYPLIIINISGCNGCPGANVADDIVNAIIHNAVGDHRALLGLTGIIHDDNLNFLAQHTTGSVDLLNKSMHPLLNHLTVLGERSGVWSGDGESDFLCLGNPRHSQTHRQTQCCSDGCKTIFHTILLVLIFPEVENSKLDKHTAQHPSGFLMNLETCSEQISGWLVISSVRSEERRVG